MIFSWILLLNLLSMFWFNDNIASLDDTEINQIDSMYSSDSIYNLYLDGLKRVTSKAYSKECKQLIESDYMLYMKALANETPLPFEDINYQSQCNYSLNFTPLSPIYYNDSRRNSSNVSTISNHDMLLESLNSSTLSIAYILLVHNNDMLIQRIIGSLNESHHTFILHIDYKSHSLYDNLTAFSHTKSNVYLVTDNDGRMNISWGGYSIVNATLNSLIKLSNLNIYYDYVILLSGTTYPLKSNEMIRQTLASNKYSIFMDIREKPNTPHPEMWHHFVECDGSLHRITRLALIRGINLFMGSQWFIMPHYLVDWLLNDSLPKQFTNYAKHIVVADEHYFNTLVKNSPYCNNLVNTNFLFAVFDRWENEIDSSIRQNNKCLSPHSHICGRSPVTLTIDYKHILYHSKALFIRKVDPNIPSSLELIDWIDSHRHANHKAINDDEGSQIMIKQYLHVYNANDVNSVKDSFVSQVDSHLDSKLTSEVYDELCLELTNQSNQIKFNTCDKNSLSQWFTIGPCITGSNITLRSSNSNDYIPIYHNNESFNYCQLRQSYGNLCIDIQHQLYDNNNSVIAYPCNGQWNQQFLIHSNQTISTNLPDSIKNQLNRYMNIATTNRLIDRLCFERLDNVLVMNECITNSHLYNHLFDNQSNRNDINQLMNRINYQKFVYYKQSISLPTKSPSINHIATSERPRLADKILNYETIPDAIKRVMESESNKPSIKHEHEINAVN